MSIEITAIIVGFAAIALVFGYTLATGSPPTPTSPRVRRALLAVLPRRLPAVGGEGGAGGGGKIYELGSGWGGNALALAAAYPDHTVIGLERSPLPWLVSCLRRSWARRRNLQLKLANFMGRDLGDGVLVVCYLAGGQMPAVEAKLQAELPPGALVASHTFAMPGWRPVDTVQADDIYASPVYLYEMPADTPA